MAQPVNFNESNEFCSRVVYIDLNRSTLRDDEGNIRIIENPERGNIRAKLTKEMQKLGWYPGEASTSFIFYKRDDENSAEENVNEAIRRTNETYRYAHFQFALLKPIRLSNVDDDVDGLKNLFSNFPADAENEN
ncbi:hypothetical protein L5515_000770 [Caenorhabditis briggsae]|uniref:Uncharacterized protein n=1 Tax=Caenorhabditis briggsae TaxID=6238 RepID=A0AAE9J2E4_CAEBR|nr:hypothetical protein L5515_000770 [Caenorhabditis briggsae]